MALKIQEVARYVSGTNTLLDNIHDGESLFIVQGSIGRRPVIADNEEEARENYRRIKNPLEDEDEESQEY